MRNYLRSIYSFLLLLLFHLLLLSQSVALLTKHLNHKSRRPNESQLPKYPAIHAIHANHAIHAIWYLLNMRSRCEFQFHASGDYSIFWHFCTKKKTYDKTEKKTIARILTINLSASAFQAEWQLLCHFFPISLLLLLLSMLLYAFQRTIDNNNSFLVSRQRVAPPKQLSTVTCHICVSEPAP